MHKLDNIKIVLCNTSHQGNIGATARAMKTMGISNLTLVNPINIPDDHALALASNAGDIIHNAQIASSLDEALNNTIIAFALTTRKREFQSILSTPKDSLAEIFQYINNDEKVAIVFGSEKFGLSIEEVEKCNRILTIPGNPEYSSLNLAQAVQIICYEIYNNYNFNIDHLKHKNEIANFNSIEGLITHIEETLTNFKFYKNNNLRTNRRIKNIISKANLERNDVDLLRGILKLINQKIQSKKV